MKTLVDNSLTNISVDYFVDIILPLMARPDPPITVVKQSAAIINWYTGINYGKIFLRLIQMDS